MPYAEGTIELTSGDRGNVSVHPWISMGRPNKLTDNQPTPLDWVKDVLYSTAG